MIHLGPLNQTTNMNPPKYYIIIESPNNYSHRFPVGTVVRHLREVDSDKIDVENAAPLPGYTTTFPQTIEPGVDCRPWPQEGDRVVIPAGTVRRHARGHSLPQLGTFEVDVVGRVSFVDRKYENDTVPFLVSHLDGGYYGWFGADQLRPDPDAKLTDPVATGHNPDNLTVSQVGDGYRLLAPEEIVEERRLSGEDRRAVEKWEGSHWDTSGWSGNSNRYTYRTRKPVGHYLPEPEPKTPRFKVGDKLFVPKGYHIPGVASTKRDAVVEVVEVEPGAELDVLARFERRDVASDTLISGPVEWWISSEGITPAPEAVAEAKPAPVAACPFKVGDAVVVPVGYQIPGVGATRRTSFGEVIDLDAFPGRVRVRMDGIAAGLPGYTAESTHPYPAFYVPFEGLKPVE